MNLNEKSEERRKKWQSHVEKQQRSGESVAGYCRQKKIDRSTFFAWRKRLKNVDEDGVKGFVRIEKNDLISEERSQIVIKTPKGYELRINRFIEEEFLQKVLRVLV